MIRKRSKKNNKNWKRITLTGYGPGLGIIDVEVTTYSFTFLLAIKTVFGRR